MPPIRSMPTKLIQIIELYKLFDYDKAKRYDRLMASPAAPPASLSTRGLLHPIHLFNDNYYLYAREGDTFKALGKVLSIPFVVVCLTLAIRN